MKTKVLLTLVTIFTALSTFAAEVPLNKFPRNNSCESGNAQFTYTRYSTKKISGSMNLMADEDLENWNSQLYDCEEQAVGVMNREEFGIVLCEYRDPRSNRLINRARVSFSFTKKKAKLEVESGDDIKTYSLKCREMIDEDRR